MEQVPERLGRQAQWAEASDESGGVGRELRYIRLLWKGHWPRKREIRAEMQLLSDGLHSLATVEECAHSGRRVTLGTSMSSSTGQAAGESRPDHPQGQRLPYLLL